MSEILSSILSDVSKLHDNGFVDHQTMEEFNKLCRDPSDDNPVDTESDQHPVISD